MSKLKSQSVRFVTLGDIYENKGILRDDEKEVIEEALREKHSFGDSAMTLINRQQFIEAVANGEELLKSVDKRIELICIWWV